MAAVFATLSLKDVLPMHSPRRSVFHFPRAFPRRVNASYSLAGHAKSRSKNRNQLRCADVERARERAWASRAAVRLPRLLPAKPPVGAENDRLSLGAPWLTE